MNAETIIFTKHNINYLLTATVQYTVYSRWVVHPLSTWYGMD